MGIGLPSIKFLEAHLGRVLEKFKSAAKKAANILELEKNKGSLAFLLICFGGLAILLLVIGAVERSASVSAAPDNNPLKSPFISQNRAFLIASPSFILIDNSTLMAVAPSTMVTSQVLGALFFDVEPQDREKEITEYIVETGDTLLSLAEKFDISIDTLLWANDLSKSSLLKAGQKLVIPPVSGVIHHVQDKDTISTIAEKYKAKAAEIIAFNDLTGEGRIYIGDILVVPGGQMPPKKPEIVTVPLADSHFIAPVASPYLITQDLHWYNAVDFSHTGNACGRPVFAAASGEVQRTGYDRLTGNYVRIFHSTNGIITFYGHLSLVAAKIGEQVKVGDIIGYIGNTGYTVGKTGCHVHFEVRGARNPFAR